MINSIAIRNFQIHKKTEVEFDPGITIISGTSDNGKSSIIRAFRWAFQNRPQGYSFRRWDTPDKAITAVDVSVDGETISRKRGKVRNEYVFQDTTYKALRSDVPDNIKEHIEILPFNIQPQSGKVFLFEDTDSEVAKLINEVSGISVIDDILKESNRRLRELNAEERLLNDMIKDKKSQATTLKVFVGLNKRVRAINESYAEVEDKEILLAGIEEDLEYYDQLAEKRDSLPNIEKTTKKLSSLRNKALSLEEKITMKSELKEFIDFIESNHVIDTEEIETTVKDMQSLEKFLSVLDEKVDAVWNLEQDVESYETLVSYRKKGKFELKQLKEEYESLKKECGVCPLCENEWQEG
jgi:exonuclease SbcC